MYELRHIEPLRAANVAGVLYAILTGAFAVILLPFFLAMSALVPSGDAGPPFTLALLVLVYPVIGAVMGWISGLLTAAIYNFIIRWTGGLQFKLEPPETRGQV